jgi:hypothetical protein
MKYRLKDMLSIGFGKEAGHVSISALKKQNTTKFKPFSMKKDPKKQDCHVEKSVDGKPT